MKTKYELIGVQIRKAREAGQMSQQELADALGYDSATAISLFEAGKRKVTITDLEKIANLFHTDIKHLLGQDAPKPDVKFALRADADLGPEDEKEILNFINFVKNRRHGR